MTIYSHLLFFLFLTISVSVQCASISCVPDVSAAPLCPENGSKVLDDRYPVQAATVSSANGVGFAAEFAFKTMFAQQKPIPIFISASEEDFEKIVSEIRFTKLLTKEQKSLARKYFVRLDPSEGGGENWQQDFMKANYDPQTGMSLVREVDNYLSDRKMKKNYITKMVQKLSMCGVRQGERLNVSSNTNYLVSGMYGGNIGSLPNGICLLGRDHFDNQDYFDNYVQSACGKADFLETPSDFLSVGHTDEFMNVIPDPSKAAPCNYAIGIASPQKGMELLEANPNEPLFSDLMSSEDDGNAYVSLCLKIKYKLNDYLWRDANDSESQNQIKGTSFINYLGLFSQFAMASKAMKFSSQRSQEDAIYEAVSADPVGQCSSFKNKDLINFIKSDDIRRGGGSRPSEYQMVNNGIQKKMNAFKQKLLEKIKSHKPSCEPELIDLPYVFSGYFSAHAGEPKGALSLFPNPSNGQLIGNTYLVPKAGNDVFAAYIEKIYKDKGVKLETVSTAKAHSKNGNLHCSTQLMRYCKPREGK